MNGLNTRKLNLSLIVTAGILACAEALAAAVTIKTNGELLEFSPKSFQVKPGEKVTLTFTNASKSMEHNFVLGKIGTADKLAAGGIAAGAPSWTPKGSEVLRATAMLKPQSSETVTFEAPQEKGDYPYLCSFPGHGQIMRGTMKVK